MSGELLSEGSFGNNGMYAANPESGELKRFWWGLWIAKLPGWLQRPMGKPCS